MPKISIDIQDDIDPAEALELVKYVVDNGKVSEAAGIPHYAWHVTFDAGFPLSIGGLLKQTKTKIEISTRRKRTPESTDSFVVRR